MYASLDRIDIVVTEPNGAERFVQTDHRSAAEIEADADMSVVFAAVRVLNPRRHARDTAAVPAVEYAARELPPPFLRRLIASARAELTVDRATVPFAGEHVDVARMVDTAMSRIGRVVAASERLPIGEAGLSRLEEDLAAHRAGAERGTVWYWESVIRLAALAGEAVRASGVLGEWTDLGQIFGTIPFVFAADIGGSRCQVNLTGKAIKFFDDGDGDSVAALVRWVVSCARAGTI